MDLYDINQLESKDELQNKLYHNLQVLTKNLVWDVREPYTNCKYYDKEVRQLTKEELDTYVMYGEQRVYMGGGWPTKCPINNRIKSIVVGEENKLTSFISLLHHMDRFYKQQATNEEIECLRSRYFKQDKFKLDFPDKNKITYADWLIPHSFFDGPMELKTKDSPIPMYCYSYF
jgi:hypothetical protein